MSGLGKGTVTSSLSHLLSNSGSRVSALKIDPYLNYDAGTMNPYQHGEVFVLEDGSEVDLDLGNYERFLDCNLRGDNNITTGKVYKEVIEKERRGEFLGNTVQIIPHVTSEIKRRIRKVAKDENVDVLMIEIGGTVGDIESMPFLEAVRELKSEEGPGSVIFGHVTLIPETGANAEQKTKPTQHSVSTLRGIGIQPDMIFCRLKGKLLPETKRKISTFTDVREEGIIGVSDTKNIYSLPAEMYSQGTMSYLKKLLGLGDVRFYDSLSEFKSNLQNPDETVNIAIVGKYTALQDAYMSHKEAFTHVSGNTGIGVNIKWIDADNLSEEAEELRDVHGILIPGGFGYRAIEGKIRAVRYGRENSIPVLGICLGFQVATIEFARNVLGLKNANSTEFDDKTPYPVIDLLPEQVGLSEKGGTMRLGSKKVLVKDGTLARDLYGSGTIEERHRHRYEVNPAFIEQFEEAGYIFSGTDTDKIRMEISELSGRRNFIASQYHSEFKSRPLKPSVLHKFLVTSALEYKLSRESLNEHERDIEPAR